MSRYFSWASVVGSECELSNTEIECALCALCKNRVALLFKPVEDRGREERGAELNLSLIRTWIWVNPWGIPQNQLWRALFHIHRTDTHMHNEENTIIFGLISPKQYLHCWLFTQIEEQKKFGCFQLLLLLQNWLARWLQRARARRLWERVSLIVGDWNAVWKAHFLQTAARHGNWITN